MSSPNLLALALVLGAAGVVAGPVSAAEFDSNHRFVATYGDGILEIDESGNIVDTYAVPLASDVAFGLYGQMYVATGGGQLVIVDADHNVLSTTTIPGDFFNGLEIGPGGDVYVTDSVGDEIEVFDGGGNWLRTISSVELNDPVELTFDANGHLFVSSHGNARVVEIDPAGQTLGTIAMFGPAGLAFGPDGYLYVAARQELRIKVIHPQTRAVESEVEATDPWGLAFTADGRVMVADLTNGAVEIFDRAGPSLYYNSTIALTAASSALGIDCSPQRFRVKVTGRYVSPTFKSKIAEKATLSYFPGSGRAMLETGVNTLLGAHFTGFGQDTGFSSSAKRHTLNAFEVYAHPSFDGVTTMVIDAPGKLDGNYMFRAEKVHGTFQRSLRGVVRNCKFKTKKKLN